MKYGAFELKDRKITGPARYMEIRFDEFQREFRDGTSETQKCVMVTLAATGGEFDYWQVFLQALQLDYAGWHGVDSLLAGLR
jgi:hypothetical protein